MSFVESGDEQSEDGELRQSPSDFAGNSDLNDISLSEEDAETAESLDIKPPQARIIPAPIRNKRHGGKSRHKQEELLRDPHRDKHHRSNHRKKGRHYREQMGTYVDVQYYRESKEGSASSSRHSERREMRYIEKQSRRERYIDDKWEKTSADKELEDLRERLLSKRSKSDDTYIKVEKTEIHRERGRHKEILMVDSVLQGDSGMYVKEIINIGVGEEKRVKKQERSKEDDKLSEEERAEQDLRREKLLEAEREMARLKEQSRIDRERRHIEKQAKRKLEEEQQIITKRIKSEEGLIVMVSDNSDNEVEIQEAAEGNDELVYEENEEIAIDIEDKSDHSNSFVEDSDQRSRSSSLESDEQSHSGSVSSKDNGNLSEPEAHEEETELKEIQIDHLPPYYPAIQGCRSVEEFQCLNRIEEGTYGVVYRARDKRTEEIVALKRLKMEKEKEGFPITSLREINTLLKGQHPNIVTVREIVVGSNMDKIFIVMDYVEHDLKSLMETMRHKKQSFTAGEVKCLLKQLLQAVAHLHDNWILHRDLKTSNLLLSHKGILKVGDFGLAREYGSPLKPYTPIVVTLWYRAPELLLCTKEYSTPIDMWSVGCIFGELLLMNAVFPGKSEIDQLNRVFKDLGTPNEKIWPGFNKLPAVQKMKFTEYPVSNIKSRFHMLTEVGLLQLQKFLTFDPVQRITAEDALLHPYFLETPLPIDPSMFPTWPAKSELGHRRALAASPKPPSGGCAYKQLGGDEDGYGFRIGGTAIENRRIPMGGGFSLKF